MHVRVCMCLRWRIRLMRVADADGGRKGGALSTDVPTCMCVCGQFYVSVLWLTDAVLNVKAQ